MLLLVKLTDLSAEQRNKESGLADMGVSFVLMGKCWETNVTLCCGCVRDPALAAVVTSTVYDLSLRESECTVG